LTSTHYPTIGALDIGRFGGPFSFEFEGMSDEAHFSAEQPGPRTASRFPQSQRDGRRPQGAGRPPRPRPQEAQRLITLTKRADFLAANRGKRAPMPGFVLLVLARGDSDPAMRVGFTVTKKIGNAVVRNRMKRRFRALARDILPESGIAGADHVLIGRSGGIERDFGQLAEELKRALRKLSA
jgi:ribonuclease P protein component